MAFTKNNFVGFESGGLDEALQTTGTLAVQSAVARTGKFALKVDSGNDGAYFFDAFLNTNNAGSKFIIGVAVRWSDVTPAAAQTFLHVGDDLGAHISLRLATDGDLELLDDGGTVVGTATTPFTNDTFHYIELYFESSDPGVAEVFVDDASVIGEVTGQDFLDPLVAGVVHVELRGEAAASTDFYVDDFYFSSGATAASDRLNAGNGVEVHAWQHDAIDQAVDGGMGGVAGASLDVGDWEDSIDGVDQTSAEYTANPARGTIDWAGPGTVGFKVDSGQQFADDSDAGLSDPDSVWTDDADAFDGSQSTDADCNTGGTRTTNELRAAGTNVAASGDDFTQVAVRVFGSGGASGGELRIEIFTDAEGELLGTYNVPGNASGSSHWHPWIVLSVPSGGWTRAKAQALEFICFVSATSAATVRIFSIDIALTDAIANDADIIATKAHFRLDRDGGQGSDHVIGIGNSGDGNNSEEFLDTGAWGPITQTNTWWSIIQTTAARIPAATENIRAGFGTLGAQDIHMYDGWVFLLHVPPSGAPDIDLDVTDDEVAFAEAGVALTGVGTLAVGVDTAAFAEGVIDLDDANFSQDLVVTDDEAAFAEAAIGLDAIGSLDVGDDQAAFAEDAIDLNAIGSLDVADDQAVHAEAGIDLEGVGTLAVADDEVAHAEAGMDLNAIGSLDVADDAVAFAQAAIDLNAIGTLDVGDDPVAFAEGAIDLDDANFTQDLDVTDDQAAFAEAAIDLDAIGSLDVADDEAAHAEGAIGITAIGTLEVSGEPIAESYAVANHSAEESLTGATFGVSQSFNGVQGVLKSVEFYLHKDGAPTGSMRARLRAESGTFGVSSIPTGPVLAQSADIVANSISTSKALIRFEFSDGFEMQSGTDYCILINYEEGGFVANRVHVGIDDTSPTHAGNQARSNVTPVWFADAGEDTIFFIRTDVGVAFGELDVDLNAVGVLDVAADPLVFAEGVINLNAVGTLAVADDNAAFAQGVIGLTAIGSLDVAGGTLVFAEGVIDLVAAGSGDMVVTDDNAAFAEAAIDLNAVGVLVVTDDPVAFAESVDVTAIGTLAVAADNAAFAQGAIDLTAIGILAVVSNPAAFAEGPVALTAIGTLQVAADAVAYGEGVINLEDLQVDLAVTSLVAFAEATINLTDANAPLVAKIQGGGHPDWVIGDQSPEQAEFERAVAESIQLFLSKVL